MQMPSVRRSLPVYQAGAVDVPFGIRGMDEVVTDHTHWDAHSHPGPELVWNERGASSVTIGQRKWAVTPRIGLWIPAGVLHSAEAPSGTWYRAALFGARAERGISDEPVAVDITPLMRLLLERLGAGSLTEASRVTTEAMVLDLLEPSDRDLCVHVPEAPMLGPIVDAVLANPGDRRTLGEWADALGVSTRTVTRAFERETGMAFAQWLSVVRAQRAIMLLTDGADSHEVAADVGYSSVSAFGAAFRRSSGLTPGAFQAGD